MNTDHRTTQPTLPPPARARLARRASRPITVAAFAVPLCVLPSSAWRLSYVLSAAFGPSQACDPRSVGEGVYIAGLSVVSVGAAALTIGLVRPWGEIFPRWLPVVGGRRVPARAVSVVAMAGAGLIGLLTVYFLARLALGVDGGESSTGCEPPGLEILGFYAPLVAWAPLLYLVTTDYRRRMLR